MLVRFQSGLADLHLAEVIAEAMAVVDEVMSTKATAPTATTQL
jgi:hypothetical protein